MQQLLDDETVPFVAGSAVVTTEGAVIELGQDAGLARKVEFNGNEVTVGSEDGVAGKKRGLERP